MGGGLTEDKPGLRLDWMSRVRLEDLSVQLHKVYVFRDNGKCNHGIVFNNVVTANTIFRCKNPEIALPKDETPGTAQSPPEISPNYFYLTQPPDQTGLRLLKGEVEDGAVYARNKLLFACFESETKKVLWERASNSRKIASCVRKKRRL